MSKRAQVLLIALVHLVIYCGALYLAVGGLLESISAERDSTLVEKIAEIVSMVLGVPLSLIPDVALEPLKKLPLQGIVGILLSILNSPQ